MQLTADVLAFLSARLATQKKNDYMPKNDDLAAFTRLNTDPCLAIVEGLEKLVERVRQKLSERNRELFFTEVGVGFHALLLEHLKRYTVSATGGLMLTKDLAMYQDVVGRFDVPIVSDRFEMLRQLGNLFIVQPAVLKSYMREGHLGKIDEALLRPYLFRRQDYSREVRDLQDPSEEDESVQRSGSSLFASLSQHSRLAAWSDKRYDTASSSAFLIDLPDESARTQLLSRSANAAPAPAGVENSPSRSGTPQSTHHLHVPSPTTPSSAHDDASFSPPQLRSASRRA